MSSHLDYEINKELGECYLFMGELDKAEEYYSKAAVSNGVHPDPYMGLATIAVQRGDFAKAFNLYKKAVDIEPNDKCLAGMGLVETEQGLHEEAFDHFTQALDKNPVNMIALLNLLRIGHSLGRLDEVVPYLEAHLAVDPLKHEVRYSLAGCLATLDRLQEAQAHAEKILSLDPGNQPARDLLERLTA